MNRNQTYAEITLEYLRHGIEYWNNNRQSDQDADAIVETLKGSEIAKMQLTRVTGPLCDSEVEAHVRRGWSYAKVLYGQDLANHLATQAGSIIAISTAITLANYQQESAHKGSTEFLRRVAFIPTACYNLVDLIAEHRGIKGEVVSKTLASEVPMTVEERDLFMGYCEAVDYSARSVH